LSASGLRSLPRANPNARLWLFDFDNTIAALEPEVDWAGSRRELEAYLRREGVGDAIFVEFPKGNLPLYSALRARLLGRDECADGAASHNALAADGLARSDPAALLRYASERIEAYELRGVERAPELPGAPALLRDLTARGNAAAIVTSNSSRTVRRWLELHRLKALVTTIVGRDSGLALKPAPDMVVRALGRFAAAPADAVFVGDSEADLGAAIGAGVGFYGVAAHNEVRGRLLAAGAREVFASPAALAAHLHLPPMGKAGCTG
jgi:phosphoglycolate phosphatase-like HAD superfamily hydrolase